MRLLILFGAQAVGEMPFERYLRLENADLSPEDAASIIADHFGYERREG